MSASNGKNLRLEEIIQKLKDVREKLRGHRSLWNPHKKMVMINPAVESGLWPECQQLTFEAFCQIRTRRDWKRIKHLCVRSPRTKFLYDLISKRFALTRKRKLREEVR